MKAQAKKSRVVRNATSSFRQLANSPEQEGDSSSDADFSEGEEECIF